MKKHRSSQVPREQQPKTPITTPRPSRPGISRRAVVAGLGLTGLLAGAASWRWLQSQENASDYDGPWTEINRYVSSFPEQLAGAEQVRKKNYNGAARCIIGMRRVHINPPIKETPTEEQFNIVGRLIEQEDEVFTIFRQLYPRHPYPVYMEAALLPTDPQGFLDLRARSIAAYEQDLRMHNPESPPGKRAAINLKSYEAFHRIEYRIHHELQAELLAGEEPHAKATADDEIREDAHLQIASRGPRIAYNLFGAAHDFSDAVLRWNRKHPDNKFALITITPLTYRKYFSQLR